MRFLSFFFFFVFFSFPVFAVTEKPQSYGVTVQAVSLSEFTHLLFSDVLHVPYVLAPQLLNDTRPVTLEISAPEAVFKKSVFSFLSSLGYKPSLRDGVYFVDPIPEFRPPELSRSVFVYTPHFRDAAYLIRSLSGLFEGRFASQSSASSSSTAATPSDSSTPYSKTSARAMQDNGSDVLIYNGTSPEIAQLKETLKLIDVAQPDINLQAFVYEVQTSKTEGSALSFALKLLGSKIKVDYGSPLTATTGALTLSSDVVDAVIATLNSDTHFKVLSSPSIRVRTGASATFTSGAQVPVLTATTQSGDNVTQSVEYRDSGVIFTVSPSLRDSVIALDVRQELSSFVTTTTGVNTSPTLNKRALSSSLSLQGGQMAILGGLTLDQHTRNVQGFSFLPSFTDSRSDEDSRTEILLLLSVSVVDPSAGGAAPRGAAPAEGSIDKTETVIPSQMSQNGNIKNKI